LIDPRSHKLKVCDFGSAKIVTEGTESSAYICSRHYRAPELLLGATKYSTAVDTWSVGCLLAEMLLGNPLFQGNSTIE